MECLIIKIIKSKFPISVMQMPVNLVLSNQNTAETHGKTLFRKPVHQCGVKGEARWGDFLLFEFSTYPMGITQGVDGLRVTPNGTKTFSWCRRTNGTLERVTIGRWPELSIDEARRIATHLNASTADGENPAEQRRQRKDETTFAELFTVYLERWAKVRKRTWRDDESKFRIHLLPLHNKKISTITRSDISLIHTTIGKKQPTYANRVLALVSKVYNVAKEVGLWNGENPASGIRHFREASRDRFLSSEEIQRMMNALLEEPKWMVRSFFQIALLTGARRANVLAMRWEQIDTDRAVWRIPETKNGKPVIVPLVPMALDVLAQLPRESEWVFPSASRTGHFQEPRKAWERILKRAQIDDARIHDLRRTMGSHQAITGASLPVIGKSLGHASQQATAIYARLSLDPVRIAMEKATESMLGVRQKPESVQN
ncbi:Tyrosine recombinase XerC [Candidatus Magnetaquicoccaceae bacterium FCR-1]|uniref:Tyrosine recombinase XerC n=1 Tax=Candidatus Magnetaquiglobus chichijimensis TaxID=3141448 RepID=A0ABQ0C8Z7_9PROT